VDGWWVFSPSSFLPWFLRQLGHLAPTETGQLERRSGVGRRASEEQQTGSHSEIHSLSLDPPTEEAEPQCLSQGLGDLGPR
jgi:hypothetical protein